MNSTLLILLPLLAALAAVASLRTLYHRPLLGAALLLAVFLLEGVLVTPFEFKFRISLYPQDFVLVLLLLAAALRILLARRPSTPQLLLLSLCFLFALSVLRGMLTFGLQQAGNEARAVAYPLAAALYFSTFTFSPLDRRHFARLLIGTAVAFAALAAFRWICTSLSLPIVAQWADTVGGGNPLRVLNASQAFLLAEVALLLAFLHLRNRSTPSMRLALIVLAVMVLLLQHRTVWVIAAVGVLLLLRHTHAALTRLFSPRLLLPAALALLAAFLLLGPSLLSSLEDSVTETAQPNSTLAWRLATWDDLLFGDAPRSPLALAVGQPFGTGYQRTIAGITWDTAPHNFYLQVFLRTGFVGLALLLALYASLLRASGRPATTTSSSDNLLPARLLLISHLLYFLPYSPGPVQGMLLGICLSLLTSSPLSLTVPQPRIQDHEYPLAA